MSGVLKLLKERSTWTRVLFSIKALASLKADIVYSSSKLLGLNLFIVTVPDLILSTDLFLSAAPPFFSERLCLGWFFCFLKAHDPNELNEASNIYKVIFFFSIFARTIAPLPLIWFQWMMRLVSTVHELLSISATWGAPVSVILFLLRLSAFTVLMN